MRKLLYVGNGNTNGVKGNVNKQNKVLFKCQKERNFYIQREVGDLIKNQIGMFFASKKILKQMEEHQKNVVFVTPDSPILRATKFRSKEKQSQWEHLKAFKLKNEERMKKLTMKLQQKSMNNLSKSSQNLMRLSRVQERHQKLLQTDTIKAIQLKKTFQVRPRQMFRRNSSTCQILDQKIMSRVKTAKQLARVKQQNNVNTYLNKMKVLEQRNLQKEIKLQNKKANAMKSLSKCNVGMRNQKQQKLIQTWAQQFQRRIDRFQRNRKIVTTKKEQVLLERSMIRNNICEQVQERKYEANQRMAQKRMNSIQSKIERIKRSPGRSIDYGLKSRTSFIDNFNKQKDERSVEDHNMIMKRVYQIIQKLKRLNDSQQLKESQINLLLGNMDPKDNEGQYKEIYDYLNLTKQKFLEQKRKEDEEKTKKNKKLNNKVL